MIFTEVRKAGASPSQRNPEQADDQAIDQASSVGALGSDSMSPALISAIGFSDVTIIT